MPDFNMLFQAPNAGAAFAQSMQQTQERNQRNALLQRQMNLEDEDRKIRRDQLTLQQHKQDTEEFQSTINAGASALRRLTSQGMPLQDAYTTVRQSLIANRFPGADHIPEAADENYIKGIMSLAKPDASEQDPSSVREYQYAKQNGFGGSYVDFQQYLHPPSALTIPYNSTVTTQGGGGGGNIPHVTDQASYDAIPPGAQYTTPDGHVRVKGGQSGAGPAGGFSGPH